LRFTEKTGGWLAVSFPSRVQRRWQSAFGTHAVERIYVNLLLLLQGSRDD
jgi:hypothetical protein